MAFFGMRKLLEKKSSILPTLFLFQPVYFFLRQRKDKEKKFTVENFREGLFRMRIKMDGDEEEEVVKERWL